MSGNADHTHHIRIRSQQLEMNPGAPVVSDDYDGKLKAAQAQLEQLQRQREELERKKLELESLNERKRQFLVSQVELTEKLSAATTRIDRELYEMRQEMEDLEQCRVCFAAHLDKIQKYNPESWTREQLASHLDRALTSIELAADEYEQAAVHFADQRSGEIFGRGKSRRSGPAGLTGTDFRLHLRNGFAFNLPVIILGAIGLIAYLVK